jgi:hypothetical protein
VKKHLFDRIPFSRIATILAITALLSTGSCGIGAVLSSNHGRTQTISNLVDDLIFVGGVGFSLAILALIVLGLAYVALWIAKDITPDSQHVD